MCSTRTTKRATMAGLAVLAGLMTSAGAGLGSTAHSATFTNGDDMPWGIVKPLETPVASDDDMPWG
ncbi:hypothetical protein [Streptomyces sp. TRM49041]|uniref:hypothetical protein n=1 Tax=Streptomyces sp. TRM49041 TaxID=2603216 RepID=UPI0011EDAF16|nr:hypothetical protein [Streptomyces sp. TRM49041]